VNELLLRLGVAALCGLAVGVEREWSAKQESSKRFAGVRTLLLLGLVGGLTAVMGPGGAGLLVLAGGVALVVVSFVSGALRGSLESTTEVAALVVLAAGYLAGSGSLTVAAALAALTALVLAEKGRVHSAVYNIRSEELSAGARFAVLALVVLPVLPPGPYGPEPGVKPQELWALVLLFAGLGFLALVAVRIAGPERGYGLAGLLGGLVSSTAVALTFSRESREQPNLARVLAVATVAASTVLNLRMLGLALVLRSELAPPLLRYVSLATVVGAVYCVILYRRGKRTDEVKLPGNPLRLKAAIAMAALLAAAVYAVHWVRVLYGSSGVMVTSGLLGLVDMDALLYSVARGGVTAPAPEAARALGVGITANAALKLALTLVLGSGEFRKFAAPGLLLLGASTVLALVLW